MTAREVLVHLAIWPNVFLWGGIVLAMIIMSITSPVLPEEELHRSQGAGAEKENAAPRHRA